LAAAVWYGVVMVTVTEAAHHDVVNVSKSKRSRDVVMSDE